MDFTLDLARLGLRLEPDRVGDALNALNPPNGIFGRRALVLPFDLALERDPAVLEDDLDVFR